MSPGKNYLNDRINEVTKNIGLHFCVYKLMLTFVTNITNKFTLELDILCACDASVDLGHHMLCLAEDEVSLKTWPNLW
jgi:hypothetical protein